MSDNDFEQLLRDGVDAARRGDRQTARKLLEQVVSIDDNNEQAWMWLATCVNTLSERRACLQKVLEINPNNARAKEALANLGDSGSRAREDEERQRIEQIRRLQQRGSAPARPQRPASSQPVLPTERRTNPLYIIAVVLVVIVVMAGIALASNLSQQRSITPTQDLVALALSATTTNTPAPFVTITIVPYVGTRTIPTLPPTFTPTSTGTATDTPTPTITPYPIKLFTALLSSLKDGDTQPGLYRMNGDGSGEQLLVPNAREVAYDPSGKTIAFVRDVDYPAEGDKPAFSAPEIFIASADNPGDATQITTLKSKISGSPSWASDGVRIVFVTDYTGSENLWTMTSDGKNVSALITTPENTQIVSRDPAWSPDGLTIVFASDLNSPGATEIFSMKLATQEGEQPVITQLTDDNGSSYSPAWSPDGKWITFVSDRSGDPDIYIMDPQGNNTRLLTVDDGGAEDRHPVFTPDSKWVTFISNREDDRFQTYLVNLRGSELVRLTKNDRDDQFIVFHPETLLRLQQGG